MAIKNNILEEVKNFTSDVRAEAITDQLMSNGVAWKEIMVHMDQFFSRNFSYDLSHVEIKGEEDSNPLLHLHLARTGLYDILPEGLFFQPSAARKKAVTATDMAEEYKINKKQELAVRDFFLPLENDFFYHRLKNFREEKELLSGLSNEDVNDYFSRFWGLAKDMSAAMARRFTLLLPYVHQISGDPQLMASALQGILREPVSCTITDGGNQQPLQASNILGIFALGNDLICGNSYYEEDFVFHFVIGPLEATHATDYLNGGNLYKSVQTFYRFFVPANAEAVTEIALQQQKMHMVIGHTEEAMLGIGTVI